MNRKAIAEETVRIMRQGQYSINGQTVDIALAQRQAEENSRLFTPAEGAKILNRIVPPTEGALPKPTVANEPTVKAILDFDRAGLTDIGVLNFASARNPGGGFLNGAMAQEESLAASSGLYGTQLRHERYYTANRECASMMYTDHAIYSPEVPFYRNARFELLKQPVTASVLTLPAVNYGQVLKKGEDPRKANAVMRERMRLSLAIFAECGARQLILGAYGCGVFGNDPVQIAKWWRELLVDEGYGRLFVRIHHAVLDSSRDDRCIRAFTSS
ncbi:TIGR02452 family protein [Paenibacillus daejeonensis]|uniref:TIGR02452 family protein n=1 Tax=Paenibacillus daejeonensis TaxID=135193 RepID=UPI000594EC8F|nr:TIGR02452 family protein [Paenibacillus daejeonensis]